MTTKALFLTDVPHFLSEHSHWRQHRLGTYRPEPRHAGGTPVDRQSAGARRLGAPLHLDLGVSGAEGRSHTHLQIPCHHLQIPCASGGGRDSEAVGKRFHGRLHKVIRHGRPWVQPRQHQQMPSAGPENSAEGSGMGQGSGHREAGNCREGAPTPTQAGPPLGSPRCLLSQAHLGPLRLSVPSKAGLLPRQQQP